MENASEGDDARHGPPPPEQSGRPGDRSPNEQRNEQTERLGGQVVAWLFEQHADELRRFVYGLVRDASLTNDVVQATFVKLVQQGHETRVETRKAWIFKVAFHEAMHARRKSALALRAGEALGAMKGESQADTDWLIREEVRQQVCEALASLPPDQQVVVQKRIYEEQTFAQIARALGIPMGTALARMHSALRKLRERLGKYE